MTVTTQDPDSINTGAVLRRWLDREDSEISALHAAQEA